MVNKILNSNQNSMELVNGEKASYGKKNNMNTKYKKTGGNKITKYLCKSRLTSSSVNSTFASDGSGSSHENTSIPAESQTHHQLISEISNGVLPTHPVTMCTRSQSLFQRGETSEIVSNHVNNGDHTEALLSSPAKKVTCKMTDNMTTTNSFIPTSPEEKYSPAKSGAVPASPLSPHKIQAFNEDKLRLDVPLSPSSAFSKLKLISSQDSKLNLKKPAIVKPPIEKNIAVKLNNKPTKQSNGCSKLDTKSSLRSSQMTEYFPIRRSRRKPKTTILQEREKEIEERVMSGDEIGLKIKNFSDKGRGVVTVQPFTKGDMVVEYVGELIDMKQAKLREEKYAQDTSKGCYMYYFTFQNNQYCIDATEESNFLGRLVNHSRNGNLSTKTVEVTGRPHLILIAKKDLTVGTELLYDYGDRSKQAMIDHPWLAL